MNILGLDHIQFEVIDLEESVEFFKKIGFILVKETIHHGGTANLQMCPGGPVLEIHASERSQNPGYDHFALLVDDLDVAISELRKKGIKVSEPKNVAVTNRRVSDFRDASGFRWQIMGE